MTLPIKTDKELINSQVNAMQASAGTILDFSQGSDYLAIVESNMGNSLWLQALITALQSLTRLSTSTGSDIDTFVGDFGLKRKVAGAAFGLCAFSRNTATVVVYIAPGTAVLSTVNNVTYRVTKDTSNPFWDVLHEAYVLNIGISSISIPVVASTAGIIGNCLANQITTISGVLVGVDAVTNPQPFTNGFDQQSDQSLKDDFILYLASLFRATKQAIQYATSIVTGVKRYNVVENETSLGNPQLGFFYVVVDDGSGNASPELLANVSASVESYRGLTIAYSVYAPTPVPIDITAHVFNVEPADELIVKAKIIAALENYITSQEFNALFAYSRIPSIIYGSDPTIIDVLNYTLNGGTSDIQISGLEIMTVGTINIIMNT